MAEEIRLSLGWKNILLGVACIVVANLLLAVIEMAVVLPGPHWIWSSVATAVAILVWFAIAPRLIRGSA
jgi:hypothetical protein